MVFDERRNQVFNDTASSIADAIPDNILLFEKPEVKKRMPVTNYHDFMLGFAIGRAFGSIAMWNYYHYKEPFMSVAEGSELIEIILSHVPKMEGILRSSKLPSP